MSALDIGDLSQPMLQPVLAYIVAFALAENPTNGVIGHAVLHQKIGEKRQIVVEHCILQCDAGCGNDHRHPAVVVELAVPAVNDPCHQIGVSLADPGARIAQRNPVLQHCVEHHVAQLDLLVALG